MAGSFEERYPNIAMWIQDHENWITIGRDEDDNCLIRAVAHDEIVWESGRQSASIDEALRETDQIIAEWLFSG